MESKSTSVERQREHFNRIAQAYRQARGGAAQVLLRRRIWEEGLKGVVAPRAGFTLLEAMCGYADGADIFDAIWGGHVYQGFDYSDNVVEFLKAEKPALSVWQQDVTQFKAGDGQLVDVVLIIGGLHHVPQFSRSVVKSLSAAIREGGYFVNLEPTSGNRLFSWIRSLIYKSNDVFDEETEQAFSVDDLESHFVEAGLKRQSITYPGLLSYVFFYNPDAFPWLNVGGVRLVKLLWSIDRLFVRSGIGRFFSFATLSVWEKKRS